MTPPPNLLYPVGGKFPQEGNNNMAYSSEILVLDDMSEGKPIDSTTVAYTATFSGADEWFQNWLEDSLDSIQINHADADGTIQAIFNPDDANYDLAYEILNLVEGNMMADLGDRFVGADLHIWDVAGNDTIEAEIHAQAYPKEQPKQNTTETIQEIRKELLMAYEAVQRAMVHATELKE